MAIYKLNSPEATEKLGAFFAANLLAPDPPALFLRGPMGAGKTAFTSALARRLPGSENAEISSPSFNVINYYPTTPPVYHCDLYRCKGDYPEEVSEALADSRALTIVEWAEYARPEDFPQNFLDIEFKVEQNIRSLLIKPVGKRAELLYSLLSRFSFPD